MEKAGSSLAAGFPKRHGHLGLPIKEEVAQVVSRTSIVRVGRHRATQSRNSLPLKGEHIIGRRNPGSSPVIRGADAPSSVLRPPPPGIALLGEVAQVVISQGRRFSFVFRVSEHEVEEGGAIVPEAGVGKIGGRLQTGGGMGAQR